MISRTASSLIPCLRTVIVYKGHQHHPLFGPYLSNIEMRIAMFKALNPFRERDGKAPWNVISVYGEELPSVLKSMNPKETLLVMPAGESTTMDKVFTQTECDFLKGGFFSKGGRGYFTCGAAYWVSQKRIYSGPCLEKPDNHSPIFKTSKLSLFEGIALGPLCPYPGQRYKAEFYSDAIKIFGEKSNCTVFLGGGGCFIPTKENQKITVLARYFKEELIRVGKSEEDVKKWENAAIMAALGEGAVLLSMFHPYYGSHDIDVEAYEKAFPHCGTNWRNVKANLSPFEQRMRFVLDNLLYKLEEMDFMPSSKGKKENSLS